jgi:hypothetical protein
VAAAERQIGGRFQFKTVAFPLAVAGGRLPAGGNVVMVFAKDAERQKAAWKYVKFTTGPVGQTTMVNSTRYMSGNEIAVKTPDLLGAFYTRSPNHLTSTQQLPLLTGASFPGDNSLKIIEVIKHHMESLVTGKRTAEQVMPEQMCPIFCQSAATSWRSNERGGTQSGSHACALGASLGGLSVDCRTEREMDHPAMRFAISVSVPIERMPSRRRRGRSGTRPFRSREAWAEHQAAA